MSERKFKPLAWFQNNETKASTTVAVTKIQGKNEDVTHIYGTAGKNGLLANLESDHLVVRERAKDIHEVFSYRLPSDQVVLAMLANTVFGDKERDSALSFAVVESLGDTEDESKKRKLFEQLGMQCVGLTLNNEPIMVADRGKTIASEAAAVLYVNNFNRAQHGVEGEDWLQPVSNDVA